jgi:hypothetical protein
LFKAQWQAILLRGRRLTTIRGLVSRQSFDRAFCPVMVFCMRRSFYVSLTAAIMLAQCGCAGAAWWLDEADEANLETRAVQPRAGSAADTATTPAGATTAGHGAAGAIKTDAAAAGGNPARPDFASGAKMPPRSPAATPAAGASAAEPLAAEVRALGFDDPVEEANALAALRAAPEQHRSYLLRTMQASAAVRKQREAQSTSAFPHGKTMGAGRVSTDDFAQSRANRLDALAPTNRFARSLAGSPAAALAYNANSIRERPQGSPRRREPIVDPNAVAVIEVEPAEELPNVVRQVSHVENGTSAVSASQSSAREARVPSDSARPIGGVWQSSVDSAIAALEGQLAGAVGADRAALEAKLRLLLLAADRRDEALRSRGGTPAGEQEFWSKEIFGLATLLDGAKQPDARQRAALAAPHLREAAERLGHRGEGIRLVRRVRQGRAPRGSGGAALLRGGELSEQAD